MATPEEIQSDLTLEIGEELPPEQFMAATRHFFSYVEEVAREVSAGGPRFAWRVQVREGSALIGLAADVGAAPEVLRGVCGQVSAGINAVIDGRIDDAGVSEKALGHLRGLSQVTRARRDRRLEVRLWVERTPIPIGPEIAETIDEDWRADYHDFGTIEGRLVAIQDNGALKLSVRDPMLARPVRCHLPDDLLDEALANFRNRIEITGDIHYRKSGAPVSIVVARIDRLPDDSDLPDAEDVRGILSATA